MQTVNSTKISAQVDTVFGTVSDLLDWPRILPHYRWVHHIGGEGKWKIVEMAVWRSWLPVKWLSLVCLEPERGRMYFRHIGGLARGMEVEWMVEPDGDSTVVRITHELSRLKVPIVRSTPGKLITAHFFVKYIADQTLHHMKRWIEEQCGELLSPV